MTDRTPRIRAALGGLRMATLIVSATVAVAACSTDGTDTDNDASPGTGAAPAAVETTATTGTDPATTQDTDPATTTEATAPATARCTPPPSDSGTPTTVEIWHALDGDAVAFFDDVVATFESEHPGIEVEVTNFQSFNGIEELAALDPDERPDVFMGSNSSVRLQYDSGLFVPPSECTDGATPDSLEDLLPIIEHTYTVDGTLMAAPYNVSTPVLMYDRRLWSAAGVDPDDPPATFAELESVVRRLQDSGAAANGMVLYDRAASWLIDQAAAQDRRLLVGPANGRQGTDIFDIMFDGPEAVATLERFRVLHREGYILWAGINQSGRDDLVQLANTAEPSGLTLHTSAALGDVLRLVESGSIGAGIEAGVAPFPGNELGGLAGGGAWWLLEHDDPARVGAAWTLVDWLVQPDRVAELAAFTGYVPTTERAAASPVITERWAEQPVLRVGYDQLAAMPAMDAAAGMQVGPMVEVNRALEVAASFAIDADQDPGEQLRAAEGTARAALDAYDEVYGAPD